MAEQSKTPGAPMRLSVNLPGEIAETLRSMAEKQNITVTEAVRRSIATQDFLRTESVGSRVVLEDIKTGKKKEVVFPY